MRCPVCASADVRFVLRVHGRDYWCCPHCEARFLDPAHWPDAATEAAYYRLHRNDVHDEGYRRHLARLMTPLLQRLQPGSSGLDYGCGPGPALAAMLSEAGHTMAVFDPLFFNDADVLARRYDFVTCTEVAEHFHRPLDEFARLDRLLAPGGWLGVMTGFAPEDGALARWHYLRDPTHVVFYRPVTLGFIASRHGWRCEFPCADVALLRVGLRRVRL